MQTENEQKIAPILTSPAQARMERLPEVRKIAVLRANAIGDFIFTLPALEAIRNAYPEAEIVLLGLQWHADFWKNRPGPVDRVVVVPPARGVSYPEDWEDDPEVLEPFFEQMRQEQFDLALQMHGGGRHSNPFVLALGARRTVGLRAPEAPPLDAWVPYSYYQPEVLRYLEVAALIGAVHTTLTPRVEITADDLEEANAVLPGGEGPLVVLNPGAGDPRRRWPAEKFAETGTALALSGAQVVVTGGEHEVDLAQSVIDSMAVPAINLAGKTSLGGLAGILSRASLMISNDSGPLHLAAAVGTATVGIYWCGNMIIAGPITRARHRTAISWRLLCPVCDVNCIQERCEHEVSFVADVSKEEVMTSALELLRLAPGARSHTFDREVQAAGD
jgi:ADP-heptose:LPS heptosyltransferase